MCEACTARVHAQVVLAESFVLPHATSSVDLEDGALDSTATFMVDGVITKAHLTKSGIVLRPLGVRRCWPLSLRVPSFVPFSEILCVSISQRIPAWTHLCCCCITPEVSPLPLAAFLRMPCHTTVLQGLGHACSQRGVEACCCSQCR